ncbi:CLUMA_CG003065, isoform A [Clunio marinus]|uniref:CLUMA_CG003065, isoform A n=1 Tax=Clunio marinus TaxID=568069 RepID=A0A1J1HP47_9DIPT|nr:CLUMA_CG003065, isoform A [Clunio marinus]
MEAIQNLMNERRKRFQFQSNKNELDFKFYLILNHSQRVTDDMRGMTDKMSYLFDLGTDGVCLSPITRSL